MSNRKKLLGGSTLLMFALSYGCAAPTGPGGATNVAGNLGPQMGAGLISNNAGGLISNNAGGLISNNAGGLISNNAGGYSILQAAGADATAPVAGARVAVFNERGEQISYAWATTNEKGEYSFKRLKPSGPVLFVKAVYQSEGRQVTLMSVAPAPREDGLKTVAVSPATSFVAKKINEMTRLRAVSVGSVKAESVTKMVEALAPKMSERAIVAAVIFPADKAAETFDFMLGEGDAGKALTASLGTVLASVGAPPALIEQTPKVMLPPPPTASAPEAEVPGAAPAPEVPGATDPSGSTGGELPGAEDPAPVDPDPVDGEPTKENTVIAKVGTLAASGYNGGLAANGSNLAAVNGSGLAAGSVAGFDATFSASFDSSGARAVTFGVDDGQRYTLSGSTIAGGGKTATAAELANGTDFVVKGSTAYVVSSTEHVVYSVNLDTSAVSVLAGEAGQSGYTATRFNTPTGITFTGGSLFVADSMNHAIRKVTTAGAVSTFAGSGSIGKIDGTGAGASFQRPYDVTADSAGNLYVADRTNSLVRKVDTTGKVTTISGTSAGNVDGTGLEAKLNYPSSIAAGTIGGTQVLFVSQSDGRIRVLSNW